MRWDEPSGLTTSSRAIWQMRDIFKMCTANRLTVLYQITNLFLQYWYSQHCHHDKHISGISDSGPTGPDKAMEGEMFPSADLSDLRPAPQRIPPSLSCEMSGHSRIILECPPPTSAITRVRTNSSPPVKPFLNISDYNWPFKNALSLWKLKIWIWGKYDKFLSLKFSASHLLSQVSATNRWNCYLQDCRTLILMGRFSLKWSPS